ncbi:CotY/CotZ family spore coat protein [Domibacillus sp. A3M-37]|uniref:CotY/CotZ family spore coat protein n=1 Tax=Domibacillus TaxID=1433999 RepID=UPI000617B00C|nr:MULTISPECIES: CotY/CotZ family spore coat protein [Domibacillus]MCP3761663.1 CotY/CotZ family spore coat protein [Domibacillus sp. A3M-37]
MGCQKHRDDLDDSRFSSESCVCEVVRAIRDIQDARQDEECHDCKDCFAEPLGDLDGPRRRNADTRVFTLTSKKGKPFFAFFSPDEMDYCDSGCVSIYFRVEDVFDSCCARLRVLAPLDDEREPVNLASDEGISLKQVCKVENFRKTRSCITVDLNEFIAVQCIKDVDLDVCP